MLFVIHYIYILVFWEFPLYWILFYYFQVTASSAWLKSFFENGGVAVSLLCYHTSFTIC